MRATFGVLAMLLVACAHFTPKVGLFLAIAAAVLAGVVLLVDVVMYAR